MTGPSAAVRYRLLVERLPGITYVNDIDSFATGYVSPQVRDLLGYQPEEILEDPDGLASLVHPDDREDALAAMRDLRAAGGTTTAAYRMVARDGSIVWVEDFADVVPEEDGAPHHVQGFLRDVTRDREVERLKDELVALVSHELRTPLTPILGYVEFLRESEPTEEQAGFLTVIERNARRLERIVGDLLFMASFEAGKVDLVAAELDLVELVAHAADAMRPQAAAGSIEIRVKTPPTVRVQGDRIRLAQVVDNLTSNALKFTGPGGVVTLEVAWTAPGRIALCVSDTGVGIPEEELGHVFERFFRSSIATRQAIQGTGLGLVITKVIVEAHGGSIGCSSREGIGTTFRVELPTGAVTLDDEPVLPASSLPALV